MIGVVVNIYILDFSIIIILISIALNLTIHFTFPKTYSPFWITMITVPIGAFVYFIVASNGFDPALIYLEIYITIPCFIANAFTSLIVAKLQKKVSK